ncbi:MAG: HDOD domain-containing protein [Fimbriimonadaceae bacterium]
MIDSIIGAGVDPGASQSQEKALARVMSCVGDLAALPHVIFKVLEISAESADTAGIEMERAIVIDPGFSSRILIHANSAAYGLPRKLVSIKEAIAFLGYRAIRNAAMTVGVFDLFIGKNDRASLRRRMWWRHSLDSAVCGRWLSRELKVAYPEEAYTCGLLHLLGKTLLDKLGTPDYAQVEALIESGVDSIQAEIEVFGVDSVTLASGAASRWGLPQDLVQGLRYAAPSEDGPTPPLCALTAIADFIAGCATDGWDANLEDERIPGWALMILNVSADKFDSLVHGGLAVIASSSRND